MSSSDRHDRLRDLLADRATHDLEAGGEDAIERLARAEGEPADAADPERAAALLHVAAIARQGALEPLPAELRARIAAAAPAHLHGRRPGASAAPAPGPRPVADRPVAPARSPRGLAAWAGWAAAAALLAVLLVLQDRDAPPAAGPAELRAALLAEADDLVRVPWTATGDAYAPEVGGEVVWSDARQEGYMLFRGLPPNDPTRNQLQLWIVDAERAEPQPIDGGVFDVPAQGEVVVPVDAKLPVGRAATFLVTLERPGGVVVSAAEHVLVTAQVP